MSAGHSYTVPARLKNAVWCSAPELLFLWHGVAAPVWPGDRVRFCEPADGALIFVDIGDDSSTVEARDGDA